MLGKLARRTARVQTRKFRSASRLASVATRATALSATAGSRRTSRRRAPLPKPVPRVTLRKPRTQWFSSASAGETKIVESPEVAKLQKTLAARRKEDPFILSPSDVKNPQVFWDVTIAGKPAGRVQIEVRTDIAPKAGENFRSLCAGDKGKGYKGTKLYEWFDGYYVNGGDITKNNGTGGDSIYGGNFSGEQTDTPMGLGSIHLLAADMGAPEAFIGKRDVVNSKFSVLMVDLPSVLAGQGVMVGQIIKGLEVLEDIQGLPSSLKDNVFLGEVDVRIDDCGDVEEADKIQ